MTTLVVDTSVIIKWLNQKNEGNIAKADQILDDTQKGSVELIAPEIAKYELGNVLLKGKQLNLSEAFISLGTAYSLPIAFITESEDLAKDTFALAYKHNVTYYDASFLSLAKHYNATLVTENVKHQGKSSEVKVTSLEEY